MIAFVTLLLGLISGVYPIEVTVSGPVAAVEFILDGAKVARLSHSPWVAQVDLGAELRPHQLVAVALDAGGKEIARATQWLNLPRPRAEVDLILEKGEDGVPTAARLTWQSVNGVKPSALGITLDGQPLVVGADGRAALPRRDLKELHVLVAEVRFPPGVLASKDVIYGGEYGSDVSSELTAVPVRGSSGGTTGALPAADQLGGWFTAGGQPAAAAAVEEGPGKVTVVCLPTSAEIRSRLLPYVQGSLSTRYRTEMRLGPEDSFQYLSLSATPFHDSRIPADLFQISPALSPTDGGVFYFLAEERLREGWASVPGVRIADAVAVAGLQAAAENHRRAVLLILGKDAGDASRYDPAAVRRYLESIHVPLVVWSLYGPNTPAAKTWGPVEDVSSRPRLNGAVAQLRTVLDSQRIVWLDGRHLPQAIALGPAAKGIDLVGSPRLRK